MSFMPSDDFLSIMLEETFVCSSSSRFTWKLDLSKLSLTVFEDL